MRSKVLVVSIAALALTLEGASGGPGGVNVQGSVNTNGSPPGTVDAGINALGGRNGTTSNPLDPIPQYVYQVPSPVSASSAGPMPTTLTGPGAFNATVVQYGATSLTGATVNISGGGLFMIHITGDLTITGGTFTIDTGTRVVFFVDGRTNFDRTQIQQIGANSSLQLQGKGSIKITVDPTKGQSFQGAAFANKTLKIDAGGASMSPIKMDPSLLSAPQEGAQYIHVLPIVDEVR